MQLDDKDKTIQYTHTHHSKVGEARPFLFYSGKILECFRNPYFFPIIPLLRNLIIF